MRREDKYPDTGTFTYYNANPKNRITTDCPIRAISKAAGIDYNTVVMEMALMQCQTGYDIASTQLIDRYLKSKGWTKHKQPRKADNTKYTGKEFCKFIASRLTIKNGLRETHIIANIGGHHIVAIVYGKVYDIWDSTDKCIGNYWVKEA